MILSPSVRPTALLVSRDPALHREACDALGRRGIHLRYALDDVEVTLGLAEDPALVLVDLTHRARLSPRTVERINRLRGRAFVLALHHGRLDEASTAFANLSVDGYCEAAFASSAPLGALLPGSGTLH